MSAVAEWAADGPELDSQGCWVDVSEHPTHANESCGQPCVPGSTLCEQHRRQLTEASR